VAHPWPPEIASDKFHCLPPTGVASDQVVMVGFHYVKPQLTIMGDIDLSFMDYQRVPFLPFIAAQPLFGTQFFQHLDDWSSWSVQLQTQSMKSVSSPSSVMLKGLNLFSARDFLSSDNSLGSADLWNLSGDSITLSWLSSSSSA